MNSGGGKWREMKAGEDLKIGNFLLGFGIKILTIQPKQY
jgi:hypothetical protein